MRLNLIDLIDFYSRQIIIKRIPYILLHSFSTSASPFLFNIDFLSFIIPTSSIKTILYGSLHLFL